MIPARSERQENCVTGPLLLKAPAAVRISA
jgi:hypothetical protein